MNPTLPTSYSLPHPPPPTHPSPPTPSHVAYRQGAPPIRLVGGNSLNEGHVEVYIQGEWGTVCDDLWGAPDAQVVCRQLGFMAQGAEAFRAARFGRGTGPIMLDNVQCNGTELYLTDYNSNPPYVQNYNPAKDAGVRCRGEPHPPRVCGGFCTLHCCPIYLFIALATYLFIDLATYLFIALAIYPVHCPSYLSGHCPSTLQSSMY